MNFGILHERPYCVGVYTPKQGRIGHSIFFLTRYIQRNFVFHIGVLRLYLDFFASGKIRISVFYMREHIELIYILQNRVENGIVYFFVTNSIQSNFVFNIGVPRQYLYFFDLGRIRIFVFYMGEHMELVYIFQNRVE